MSSSTAKKPPRSSRLRFAGIPPRPAAWRQWIYGIYSKTIGSLSWTTKLLWLLFFLALGVIGLFSAVKVPEWAVSATFGVLALAAIVVVGIASKFARSTLLVMVLGTVMTGVYLTYTSYGERNFDVKHQKKYVSYLIKHHQAPPDAHCFICHHPPLYYASAAVAHEAGRVMKMKSPFRATQAVSFFSVVLMGFCTAWITMRCTSSVAAVNLATALLMFWPYTLVMSGRLHNDTLATALMVAGGYACIRWFQDRDLKSLIMAAILCALAVFAKSNGYVLVVLLFCAGALVWWDSADKKKALRRMGPVLLALIVALGGYATNRGSAKQYEKEDDDKKKKDKDKKKDDKKKDKDKKKGDKKEKEDEEGAEDKKPALNAKEKAKLAKANAKLSLSERLLGSAGKIGQRSWMGNEPFNYLYFDLESFIKHPYVLARHDGYGRQFFWNHALKSALFSTHNHRPDIETSYRINSHVAGVMGVLLLAMIAFGTISLPQARRKHLWVYSVLILAGLGFLGGGTAFRILVPHSHHSDFRHMFAALVPAVVAYALMVEHWRRRDHVMHYVGLGIALLFMACAVFYYVPKHDWVVNHSPVHYVVKPASALKKWAKVESKWNEFEYAVLESSERLWMDIKGEPTGYGVSVAADHNDVYEIRVIGEKETRVFDVGTAKKAGIAIYSHHLVPPVHKVRAIEVRPRGGDHRYSIGHLILNPSGYNTVYYPPKKVEKPKPESKPKEAKHESKPELKKAESKPKQKAETKLKDDAAAVKAGAKKSASKSGDKSPKATNKTAKASAKDTANKRPAPKNHPGAGSKRPKSKKTVRPGRGGKNKAASKAGKKARPE